MRQRRDLMRPASTQHSWAATLIPWPKIGGKRQAEFAKRDQPARESVEPVVAAAHAARHSEPRDVPDPLRAANRAVDGRHPE